MHTRSLLLFGLVLALGCGNSKVGTVSGVVTLNDKPLPNARVDFQPKGDDANPGAGSTGQTNERGEYTLTQISGGSGAVVGMHTVRIYSHTSGAQSEKDEAPDPKKRPREIVPLQYNKNSTLTFEVKPGHNTANFPLKTANPPPKTK
jgi:hypothetical protein